MKSVKISSLMLLALTICFYSCKKQTQVTSEKKSHSEMTEDNTKQFSEGTYGGLRQKSIFVKSAEIGLSDLEVDEVYGVIMDFDFGTDKLILIAYKTGDANLCYKSGIMIKGSDNNKNLSKQLVELSNHYVKMSKKTETIFDSDTNLIRFYFLTNGGTYCGQEELKKLPNSSSPWTEYCGEAFKLVDSLILAN